MPGQWVVQVEAVHGRGKVPQINARLRAQNIHDIRFAEYLGQDAFLLRADPAFDQSQIQSQLASIGKIRSIQPDDIAATTSLTNDPRLAEQWALNQGSNADINAPEAWDISTGSSDVVVAVIDSGVDYTHPDLAANIWTNPGEIAGNGADDDGNGYIDDTRGWDWANYDNNPADDNGHGTQVAGQIAAIGNNGIGVAGVTWNSRIMPLKFIDASGSGMTSNVISAIYYVIDQKVRHGVNVRAVNASFVSGMWNLAMQTAIEALRDQGILFIAGAGNGGADGVGDNNDASPVYPASYPVSNVISVAATTQTDQLASFSNYGLTSVHLAAPGVGIVSTAPGGYGASSGTSDSVPFVSGAVALAASVKPGASATEIKSAILGGVDAVASLTGKMSSGGRLNLRRMLEILSPQLSSGDGLSAVYYDNADLTGASISRKDPTVYFDWSTNSPDATIGNDSFSARYTGQILAPASGAYTFTTIADDGVRLWINNQLLIDRWSNRSISGDLDGSGSVNARDFNIISGNFGRIGATQAMGDLDGNGVVNSQDWSLFAANYGRTVQPQYDSGAIILQAGQKYSVKLEYYESTGRASLGLLWQPPAAATEVIPATRLFSQIQI